MKVYIIFTPGDPQQHIIERETHNSSQTFTTAINSPNILVNIDLLGKSDKYGAVEHSLKAAQNQF